jgi:ketosteroid isomerase-like protein
MNERDNTKTIETLYEAFGRQDVETVLALLAEDVRWTHPRPRDIPWGGRRSGREAVAKFFEAVGSHLEVERFVPQQWVACDDRVIVLGTETMTTRQTGHTYDVDWVHAFQLRDGKVVAFEEYTDTATIVDALERGRA